MNASGVNAVDGLSEELSEELREITTTPDSGSDDGISFGAIAGIVAVVLVTALVVYKKRNNKSYDVDGKSRHDVADVDVAFNNKTYMAPQEILGSHVEEMISSEPEPFKMVDQKSTDDGLMVAVNPGADFDDTETYL